MKCTWNEVKVKKNDLLEVHYKTVITLPKRYCRPMLVDRVYLYSSQTHSNEIPAAWRCSVGFVDFLEWNAAAFSFHRESKPVNCRLRYELHWAWCGVEKMTARLQDFTAITTSQQTGSNIKTSHFVLCCKLSCEQCWKQDQKCKERDKDQNHNLFYFIYLFIDTRQ